MRVQLVEEDQDLRGMLTELLAEAGISVRDEPPSERDVDGNIKRCDLAVLGQHSDNDACRRLLKPTHPTPCLVILPDTSPQKVIEMVKRGAIDVINRSESPQTISKWIIDTCSSIKSKTEEVSLDHFQHNQCPKMYALDNMIQRISNTDSTVLIAGETGTGKELAARQIHRLSSRGANPLITVNCAAIPDTLIESELFGYEKGSFTGATAARMGLIEAADGSTLFLDEIGELPLAAQARLLRFIQEGEIRRIGSIASKRVNVRLICATHRNLSELARENLFRQDLFYRIDVLRLDIPPLRDRGPDRVLMAEWLAERLASKLGAPNRPLSCEAIGYIREHNWPGNVRELRNSLERAIVMSEGDKLDFESRIESNLMAPISPEKTQISEKLQSQEEEELSLEDYFQRFVLQHQDNMNETELAKKLGISRKCLWERRQRFGLPRNKQKSA